MTVHLDHPLPDTAHGYGNPSDPAAEHLLADQVQLARHDDGTADFTLIRHSPDVFGAGGILSFGVALSRKDGKVPNVSPLAVRRRIILRTQATAEETLRDWQDIQIDSRMSSRLRVYLTPTEAQLMHQLALSGDDTVEAQFDVGYLAVRSGTAWELRTDTSAFAERLRAITGGVISDPVILQSALADLPPDIATWHPLNGQDAMSAQDWSKATQVILARLFDRVDGGWQLRSDLALGQMTIRLDRPWTGLFTERLDWSLSQAPDLTATDAALAIHFPQRPAIKPRDSVTLQALNEIPLDPQGAMVLRVDLDHTDSTGTRSHDTLTFRPEDDQSLQTRDLVFPAITHPLTVNSKAQIFLPPNGGVGFPMLWPADATHQAEPDPLRVDLSSERLDVTVTKIAATPDLLAAAEEITVIATAGEYQTTVTLTADVQQVWCVTPKADVVPTWSAQIGPMSHTPHLTLPSIVHLTGDIIRPLAPDQIAFEAADTVAFGLIDLMVNETVVDTKTLRPDAPTIFEHWSQSLLTPLEYSFTASVVYFDDTGATQPMETLPSRTAALDAINLVS